MKPLTDSIEAFIKSLLEEGQEQVDVQRNELAQYFRCAPSQITYVLSTRFTPDHGYIIESRRGGGGYIRIRRVQPSPGQLVMHTINAVGSSLDYGTASALCSNLVSGGALSEQAAKLMLSALSDAALRPVPQQYRDGVRAAIFKQMLISTIS